MSVVCLRPEGCGKCGSPLPKRRRRWCSDECRQGWYVDHRWTDARHAALTSADFRCAGCGARATEVDHVEPRKGWPLHKPTCLHHQANLRALCHDCHVNRSRVFDETPQSALDFGASA